VTVPRLRKLGLSINLSPRQLYRSDFVGDVRDAIEATGFDPSLLTLEITETALMSDIASVRARLLELHELGIRFALDDFGTGYSSLMYLRQFPIDILKIDRSFIAGVSSDRQDASVTKAILLLGKTLELSTVAEGVERQDQADELLRLDCVLAQGFHFAAPMNSIDAGNYLRLHAPQRLQEPPRRGSVALLAG